ncbi:MAG: ABC transporter substrate-binding protein [Thiomicrorhabdus sp.]|nr:ABC transporter substrate-binding protein [Thiomicrorhabdus sp.]
MNNHKQTLVRKKHYILGFILFLALLSSAKPGLSSNNWSEGLGNPKTVKLQLKWQHQFQFAGFYMAQAKGFYQDAGLNVEFIEAKPGINPINEVLSGKSEFGIGTSELLLNYVKNKHVVVLGVIFQHSPLGLAVLENSGIDTIHDLVGRKVMIEENSSEIYAFLQHSQIRPEQLILQPHGFNIEDLINQNVDATSIYTTSEIYDLAKHKIPYRVFTPRMAGIDFYGDNFFTTESFLRKHPNLVEQFRRASIRGWKYAMSNIDETVQYIQQHYAQQKTIAELKFEAQAMQDLMRTDLIEPGHMSDRRWQHIASVYQELGLLQKIPDLEGFIYQKSRILDRLENQVNNLILIISGTGALVLFALFLARRFYRLKTQLKTMVDQSPLAILLISDDFRIIEWNQQASKLFGWSEQEVINQSIFDFLVLDANHTKVKHGLNQVLSQQKTLHIENKNYCKDGHEISCNWSNAPFKIQDKNYVICMALDTSELRDLKALSLKKEIKTISSQDEQHQLFLQKLVKTMNLCLEIWEESTSNSKVQLAETSGLWRVSLDGSTAKTRTLDKYLSIETIPAKPRWKNVINTANYILRTQPEHPSCGELQRLKNEINPPTN